MRSLEGINNRGFLIFRARFEKKIVLAGEIEYSIQNQKICTPGQTVTVSLHLIKVR